MKKKKVLFIVEAMGGGVFTYIVDLANELANKYEIYIAYAIRKQTPDNYRDYFDKRVHLIKVHNFTRSINPSKDIAGFFEIRQIAKKVEPDIIHLHSSKAGVLGRLAFDGKNIPLFYTPHGYSFLMQNSSAIKRAIYKIIEVFCGKRRCTTISCSAGENEESKRLTANAVYVNNAINTVDLKNMLAEVQKEQHKFTVFTLGRICYQKNPSLFNSIAEAMPDIQFLWIGDGELREELTAPNIKITGWAERKDALKYSVNADVFLLPSLWEGLPMSLLEAMYMEKPCVVSNVIGNKDVIHNNDNGYVCDSVEEFVKAIREIKDGKAEKYIKKAKKDIFDFYDTRVQAEQYSRIYETQGNCNILRNGK